MKKIFFISIITIFLLTTYGVYSKVKSQENSPNFIKVSDYQKSKKLFQKALSGDNLSLEILIENAIKSADEMLPEYLATILIEDYERVVNSIEKIFQEEKDKEIAYEVLKYGITAYSYYNNQSKLINFYNKKRMKSSKIFSFIFDDYLKSLAESSTNLDDIKYSALNLIDSKKTSAWVEGDIGPGINSWIKINTQTLASSKSKLKGLIITNGYAKSNKSFYENNRIKKLKIEISDGQNKIVNLKDTMEDQILYFNPSIINYVKLTILDIYKGSKFDDTCLSEVVFLY